MKLLKNKLPLLLPIRSVMFILSFAIISLATGKALVDLSQWWSVIATICNFLVIGLLIYVAKKNNMSYGKLINYKKGQIHLKEVICAVIVISVMGIGGMYIAGWLCYGKFPYMAPMLIQPISIVLAVLDFTIPVAISFAEDGLYLGCGVNQINNKWVSILVPAFFYALQHCFIPTLIDGRYIIYRFLSYLPLTIFMCWRYYNKRNPVPLMIGHGFIDIATVVWIFMTSSIPGFYEMLCSQI